MVLSTHIIIGAAVAQFFPQNPVLAFGAALTVHYASDLIPHWAYHPSFIKKDPDSKLKNEIVINRRALIGVGQVIADISIGITVAYLVFPPLSLNRWVFGAIILGSILPDILQASYFWLKWPMLRQLQIFHDWIHHPKKYEIKNPWWGIGSQIIMAVIVIALAKLL